MLLVSTLFSLIGARPSRPDPVKNSIYECGFATIGGRWSGFNFRFYAFALLFVIFDVEVVFLFPWASSFGFLSKEFGAFVLIEMLVFIAVLVVGWAHAWRKGDLQWR
ncbi:MAG: NADH-quinone oxidoreductase subunit A [SAR202 cluster bacterium]|nr:NADH-quinone oxidoreductase subunit A [SAR202 cluster bacterium]